MKNDNFMKINELNERDRTELIEFLNDNGVSFHADNLRIARRGVFFDLWMHSSGNIRPMSIVSHPRDGWAWASKYEVKQ